MTIEELQKKQPELYAQAVAAGVKQERERTTKLIGLARKEAVAKRDTLHARVLDAVVKGEPYAETVEAVSNLLTADLESPPAIAARGEERDTASGEPVAQECGAQGANQEEV